MPSPWVCIEADRATGRTQCVLQATDLRCRLIIIGLHKVAEVGCRSGADVQQPAQREQVGSYFFFPFASALSRLSFTLNFTIPLGAG